MYIKTAGELKEYLKNVDDDTLIIHPSDNFELGGCNVLGMYLSEGRYRSEKRQFSDAFDGGVYFKDIYVNDEGGTDCLCIN